MPVRWPLALEDAACRALPPQVFDAKTPEDEALALQVCASCRCPKACYRWMRPQRSFYDGVAAGRVWRDGKPVR